MFYTRRGGETSFLFPRIREVFVSCALSTPRDSLCDAEIIRGHVVVVVVLLLCARHRDVVMLYDYDKRTKEQQTAK